MSNIKYLIKIGEKAKIASAQLSQLDNKEKNKVLSDFLKCIKSNKSKILKANKVDIEKSKKNKIKDNLIDRTMLNEDRINSICTSIEEVISFQDATN